MLTDVYARVFEWLLVLIEVNIWNIFAQKLCCKT